MSTISQIRSLEYSAWLLLIVPVMNVSGSAKIFGLDAVKDSKAIRRRIGYVPSVLVKRARPITFACIGLTLVLYFIYSISRISGIDGTFGYISPFKWVNVAVLSPGFGIEPLRMSAFIGLTLFLTGWQMLFTGRKTSFAEPPGVFSKHGNSCVIKPRRLFQPDKRCSDAFIPCRHAAKIKPCRKIVAESDAMNSG